MASLPRVVPGSTFESSGTASQWQTVINAARMILDLRVQWPLQLTRSNQTLSLRMQAARGTRAVAAALAGGVAMAELVVQGDSADAFDARRIGDLPGQGFWVAKPWMLRRTPFDGQTRQGVSYVYSSPQRREATNNQDTFVELVTPNYILGDLVLCAKITTKVMIASVLTEVEWLDIGNSRAWALEPPEEGS